MIKHFFESIDGWSQFSEQGELLNIILEKIDTGKKINIVEVGVYKGRCTAMWVVELINKDLVFDYNAIDHFEGSEEHRKDVDYYSITKDNLLPVADKVTLIKSDSTVQAKKYSDQFFDIVYIDASHDYDAVKNDIEAWLPKVKNGGVLCGDDYIDGWPGVIQAVNEKFNNIKIVGKQQWYYIKD